MLVNMSEILREAEAGHYAIGCFNTPNIETIQAVIAAAEQEQMPVILAHAQSMDPPASLDYIGRWMVHFASASSVPVCVHLDHGTDVSYIQRAMSIGFTSVMCDYSHLPFHRNALKTRDVSRAAHRKNITVEAELGHLVALTADSQGCASDYYTDPLEAQEFAYGTGVDALTVCFGTAHGQYPFPPKLDIPRLKEIRSKLTSHCRIVMHGASGVDDEQIRAAIEAGVSKINYYSSLSRGCSKHIYQLMEECQGNMHWHMVHKEAVDFMTEHARRQIRLFAGKDSSH